MNFIFTVTSTMQVSYEKLFLYPPKHQISHISKKITCSLQIPRKHTLFFFFFFIIYPEYHGFLTWVDRSSFEKKKWAKKSMTSACKCLYDLTFYTAQRMKLSLFNNLISFVFRFWLMQWAWEKLS